MLAVPRIENYLSVTRHRMLNIVSMIGIQMERGIYTTSECLTGICRHRAAGSKGRSNQAQEGHNSGKAVGKVMKSEYFAFVDNVQ